MVNFALHQRVMDMYTGRIGTVEKVMFQDGHLVYQVKFKGYIGLFNADELKEQKFK
jgi:hypothetical protein